MLPPSRYAGSRPDLMALYRVFGETLTVVASSSTVNALSFVSIISIMLMKGNTQIPPGLNYWAENVGRASYMSRRGGA